MTPLPPLGMGTAGIGNLYAPVSPEDARVRVDGGSGEVTLLSPVA